MLRRRAALICLGIALALLALDAALFLAPRQMEARLRALLAQVFRTPVELREIGVSLREGLVLRGLVIHGPSGERAVVVDEARVGIDWRRLAPGEIRIEWPELDLRRNAAGTWNLVEALQPGLLAGESGGPLPELPRLSIRVSHAKLRVQDAIALAPGQSTGVDDLSLTARLSTHGITFQGALVDPIALEARVRGEVDLRGPTLELEADVRKLKIAYGTSVKGRIPPVFWPVWEMLKPHGTGDIAIRVQKRPEAPISIRVDIDVLEGGVCVEKFPYPARDAQGRVQIESDGGEIILVRLRNLHGGREGGTYRCDGTIRIQKKWEDDLLDLAITAENMPVDGMLMDALPKTVGEIVRRFSPSGRGDAKVRVYGRLAPKGLREDDVHVSVDVTARDVLARFRDFPVPCALEGTLLVRDTHVTIEDLHGEAAGGRVQVRGEASPERVDVRVEVDDAVADERLEAAMLPRHRRISELIHPRGRVDAAIHVFSEPDPQGGITPTFAATLTAEPGLEGRFADFPYPLSWRAGQVRLSPSGAVIERVQATSATPPPRDALAGPREPLAVEVGGVVRADDVEEGRVEIRVQARNLPVDARFLEAAAATAATITAALGPEAGLVRGMTVTAIVPRKDAPLELFIDADLLDVVLRPPASPLPARGVRGRIRMVPGSLGLEGVTGMVARAPLTATGAIALDEGGSSTAAVRIAGVELGAGIEGELSPAFRRIFELVRPEGRLDVLVRAVGAGTSARTLVSGDLSRGSFLLSFFPLAATGCAGRFTVDEREARIERIEGRMGDGALALSGHLDLTTGGPPPLELRVSLTGLDAGSRLRDACPEGTRRLLEDMAVKGRLSVEARLRYAAAREGRGELTYVGELGMREGSLDVGLLLEGVEARMPFHGTWALDRRAGPPLEGALHVRRAHWKKQSLTDMRGRFALGDELFTASELRGDFLGGVLEGSFYAWSTSPKVFGADLRLTGARVERWTQDAYEGKRKASGRLDGTLTLVGQSEEGGVKARLLGLGGARVFDGRLWELPTFAGILSALSLELPGTPAFDDASARLRLDGKTLVIERCEFSSPALSFMGGGTLRDGNLDLRLTHEIGRNWFAKIPLFGTFWEFVKGNLVETEIRGPPSDPSVRLVPLKAITDSARRLMDLGGSGGDDGAGTRGEPRK